MRDGRIRRGVKALARWNFDVNLALHRAIRRAKGERPFVLGGTCQTCARCCEAPSIQVSRWVWHPRTLRWLFLCWQRTVNGFQLVGRELPRTFVFRCTHFDPETRACDSYDSRPGMCRDYPRTILWQARPELFPECGYRPLAANADELRRELETRGLPKEQLDELNRKLYLE